MADQKLTQLDANKAELLKMSGFTHLIIKETRISLDEIIKSAKANEETECQ